MNKLGKTVVALALTATIGFSGQALAQTTTDPAAARGTGVYGTGTTGAPTDPTGNAAGTTTGTTTGTATGTTTGTGAAGTGAYGRTTGADNTARNYGDNLLNRMNTNGDANDRTGYGYGGNGGNYNNNAYTGTAANDANDGSGWGWLGLLGLIGLAGARGGGGNRNNGGNR